MVCTHISKVLFGCFGAVSDIDLTLLVVTNQLMYIASDIGPCLFSSQEHVVAVPGASQVTPRRRDQINNLLYY